MNVKTFGIIGGSVFAVAKFYFGLETKTALWLAGTSIVAAGLSDNLVKES